MTAFLFVMIYFVFATTAYAADIFKITDIPKPVSYEYFIPMDAQGGVVAWVEVTGVGKGKVRYYNANTKELGSVSVNSYDIRGLSVLSSGIYWADAAGDGTIYSFSPTTKKLTKLLSFKDIGTFEAQGTISKFEMINSFFFTYTASFPGGVATQKQYNIKTGKAFGENNYDTATGAILGVGDYYEFYKISTDAITDDFKPLAYLGEEELLYYKYDDTKQDTQHTYRLKNLSTGIITTIKDAYYAISFHPSKDTTNRVVVSGGLNGGTIWKFNPQSVDIGSKIATIDSGNIKNLAYNGSYARWVENDKDVVYYWAKTDTSCVISHEGNKLGLIDEVRLTEKYIFTQGPLAGGNSAPLYYMPAICFGADDSDANQPVSVAEKKNLVKSTTLPAVYYKGNNGKRYVFSDQNVFYSWFDNFSGITTISPSQMAEMTIGGNVTYRPGTTLVKITSDPKVYAVDAQGTLRWISSESVAKSLYGLDWAKKVKDIPDYLFTNYTIGSPINSSNDFNPTNVTNAATSINTDKKL